MHQHASHRAIQPNRKAEPTTRKISAFRDAASLLWYFSRRRHPERSQNVTLGRGGIREIGFLAQVFQLIRGGREPELRDRSTRKTLNILAQKRLLAQEEVDQLQQAYIFLRNLEHRLQ